ncbi:MAG: phospholipase D-like domain-containing protein [Bryobacteraceae bacterium]
MQPVTPGSAPSGSSKKPTETRRWLKRRVPKELLYRLAPPKPKRVRLGVLELEDRIRSVIRGWWAWLALGLFFYWGQWWVPALVVGAVSFILYHTSSNTHAAIYPLETELNIQSKRFRTTLAGVTGAPVMGGNAVTIYNNGDQFYPAMLDAIDAATASVTMEQYIFWDGQVGRRFAEAFAQKARQGVPVKLLLDAIGSATLGRELYRILEAGGVQLAWFHPIHWYTLHRANNRNHRKSLVVDGKFAFTGGAGIADHWLGCAESPAEWRDVQICVHGPAARAMQSGFAQNWLETTGEIIGGESYFPESHVVGRVEAQTILSSPITGTGAAGTMYMVALQCARKELFIANPYFIPDSRLIQILAGVHKRGVTIRLMVAGPHTDTWWARQNSVRHYGQLIKAGVEIYEYQLTMLHQKTMIVDGLWATVGTTNFDNRSFAMNEETNVCLHDAGLVAQLREDFMQDLQRCGRLNFEDWRGRGLRQRAKEWCASLVEDQM